MSEKPWFENDAAPEPGAAAASSGAARGIDPAALRAAVQFVGDLATPAAAALFATMVELRLDRPEEEAHEAALVAFLAGFDPDGQALAQIRGADADFEASFSTKLVAEADDGGSPRLRLASTPAAIVEGVATLVRVEPAQEQEAVKLDERSQAWVAVVAAAVRSGRGHHLALRAAEPGDRGLDDFAQALAASPVGAATMHRARRTAMGLLGCEMHAGPEPLVILVGEENRLVADAPRADPAGWDEEGSTDGDELKPSAEARALLPALGSLRNTYVWRVPPRGDLPRVLAPVFGGLIAAVAPDRTWCVSRLLEERPWLGAAAARRLLAATGDPRDAEAVAALVEAAMATPGLGQPDAACSFVTQSFGACADRPVEGMAATGPFDERLIACDADGLALLHRGEALSAGCRVLAAGPPSGGKSRYAYALAHAISMASGRAIVRVEPEQLLARAWGATERLVAALWRRAEAEHLVLLADEIDSLCARREPEASASGNAYLIQTLTNEWLRQLDLHPGVPLVATTNNAGACDRAVLRRFTIVVEVGDELSPEQERLAWTSILGCDPPGDWRPCGAAVGDFTAALARCRLLGRDDPRSLDDAVAEARRVRLGPLRAGPDNRRGALH